MCILGMTPGRKGRVFARMSRCHQGGVVLSLCLVIVASIFLNIYLMIDYQSRGKVLDNHANLMRETP